MKTPVNLIWELIGDAYSRIFVDEKRYWVEAMWQGLSELAGDLFNIIDYYQTSKNIFEVKPYAPYGSMYVSPRLIDYESMLDGIIIGSRGDRWVLYSGREIDIEEDGYFRIIDALQSYDNGQSFRMLSDGAYHYVDSDDYDLEGNPSFAFGEGYTERWTSDGSRDPEVREQGLYMNPSWVNQVILTDSEWIEGTRSWTQKWIFRVVDWDETTNLRSLSVNLLSDYGPGYEIRLYDKDGEVKAASGAFAHTTGVTLTFSGSDISRTRGSWIGDSFEVGYNVEIVGTSSNDGTYEITAVTATTLTLDTTFAAETVSTATVRNTLTDLSNNGTNWRSTLIASDEDDPTYVEFEVYYDATAATFASRVWVGGGSPATQDSSWPVHAGRKKTIVDAFNQYKEMGVVLDFVYCDGQIADDPDDVTTDIGESFTYVYQVDPPIVNASLIRTTPWNLVAQGTVDTQSSTELVIDMQEAYNFYSPENATITDEDGNWIVGDLDSQDDYESTYTINGRSAPGVELTGDVTVAPWSEDSIEFLDTGIFSLKRAIPQTNMWLMDCEGKELDMYERYGRILQMDEREDSQTYLNALRGMQYGLLNLPAPTFMKRAIGAISSVPYAEKPGTIDAIERDGDFDLVFIGGRTQKVPKIWKNLGLLRPVGYKVDMLEPLVTTAVKIFDWTNNPSLVRERVGYWKQWSTFVVQTPASTIGMSEQSSKDIDNLLTRAKDIHTDYILEFKSTEDENLASWRNANEDEQSLTHTIEDMMFDDHGEVIDQNMKYQTVGGEDYTEEYQFDLDDLNLDEGRYLDSGNVLDSIMHKWDPLDNSREIRTYYIKENTHSVGKNPIHATPVDQFNNTYIDEVKQPHSMVWVYEGVTSTKVTLASYGWFDVSPAISAVALNDVWIDTHRISYICGDTDTIFVSYNGGLSWAAATVTGGGSNNFISIDGGYACNGQTGVLFGLNDDGTWTDQAPSNLSSVLPEKIHFPDASNGFIAADDGSGNIVFSKSADGGSTWSSPAAVVSSKSINDIFFYDENHGVIATNAGVYWTGDGGGAWSSLSTGVNFLSAVYLGIDRIVACDNAGTLYRTNSPPTSFVLNPANPTGAVINMLRSNDDFIYGVGVSAIIKSDDDGLTFSDDTPVSPITWNGLDINGNVRLAAGASNGIWKRR